MTTWRLSDIQNISKQAGVYQIKNVLNGHSYIGSTNNFYDRLIQHRSHLRKQKHHSIALQRAYDKYGESNFEVNILEIGSYKKDNAKRTKIIRIYKNGMEKVYSSVAEAAKDTGNIDNRSAISDCLRGKRKTAYGSKWRYYK